MKRYSLLFIVDMLLVLDSILLLLLFKPGIDIYISVKYTPFYCGYFILWAMFFGLSEKHVIFFQHVSLLHKLWSLIKSGLYVAGLLLIIFIGFQLSYISRGIFFGSLLITLSCETIILVLMHLMMHNGANHSDEKQVESEPEKPRFRFIITNLDFLSLDIVLLWFSFLVMTWVKPATIRLVLPMHWKPFLLISIIWVLLSFVNQKYNLKDKKRFSEVLSGVIWADAFILAVVAFIVFVFRLFHFSRIVIFGSMGIAFILETIVSLMMYYAREFVRSNPTFASTDIFTHSVALEEDREEPPVPEHVYIPEFCEPGFREEDDLGDSVQQPLRGVLQGHDLLDVFEYIEQNVDLDQIHYDASFICNTSTRFNIESIANQKIELLFNQHKINDFRRINMYLIEANRVLKNGGVFIGCAQTIQERYRSFLKRFTPVLGRFLYVVDFIFNRIFPKLKLTQGLYFAITKGRNRPLSKCEVLGRLNFCGFRIVQEQELNGMLFFIAVKGSEPSQDPSPSYGPLFRMKRNGKGGRLIYVFKLRSMHPFAEYLQGYMVDRYGYGSKGKIFNDFRVTTWGKWMRKFWLDELPQLINWVKGDLGLVGVRPLSQRFLQEYPDELREERLRWKPGCIPPSVALRMQGLANNIDAERIYLEEKRRRPIWTDIKYFVKAVYNILTNRVRSE